MKILVGILILIVITIFILHFATPPPTPPQRVFDAYVRTTYKKGDALPNYDYSDKPCRKRERNCEEKYKVIEGKTEGIFGVDWSDEKYLEGTIGFVLLFGFILVIYGFIDKSDKINVEKQKIPTEEEDKSDVLQNWDLDDTVRHDNKEEENIIPKIQKKYKLIQANFWLAIILFWLISMIGASIFARQGNHSGETGWITLVMLVFVIVCMATERGTWKIWKRVLFVFLALILQIIISGIISGIVVLPVAALLAPSGRLFLLDRLSVFLASLPILIFAMRHSRLFVKQVTIKDLVK